MAKVGKKNEEQLITDKVYHTLRDSIIAGKLKPRERLNVSRLADELGVSRTPIKIAMDMLALEGLVEVIPHSGAFVSDIYSEDLEEIYLMRSVLEGLAARLAVEHITQEDIAKLEKIVQEYDSVVAANDRKKALRLNADFHISVALACKKHRLINEIKKLYEYCIRYRVLSLSEMTKIEFSHSGHKEILEALKSKDPDRAERAVRQHLSKAPSFIYETLKEFEKESTLSTIKDFWRNGSTG